MNTAIYGDISETIEQAQRGDTAAFSKIVRRYQSLVSGVLFSATGDFHQSEDLAQETFLIAWHKLCELKNSADIAPWLCAIARNLAHRSFRKKQVAIDALPDEKASEEPGPVSETLRREQSELVWSAIAKIPEPYRETLVLYYRSGQSITDIASVTDSSEEAIRQRLVRARKSLKVKLEEMIGGILSDTAPGDFFTLGVMTVITGSLAMSATQTAVAATSGVTTTAALGTGGAAGGKTLGAATLWSVLGPLAYFGWLFAIFLGALWTVVRNTPTLRSRRFRVHTIFRIFQYYLILSLAFGLGVGGVTWLMMTWFPGHYYFGSLAFILTFFPFMAVAFSIQMANYRKMIRIIENDLGLAGPRTESYSYPRIEKRFFRSFITNVLVFETLAAAVVILTSSDGSSSQPFFLLGLLAATVIAGGIGTIYYLLGRYFLEICRTKRNFLAAPPLIDRPFEVALLKTGKTLASVDHPRKGGMAFGVYLLMWTGIPVFGIYYLSHYSWDKNPVGLGICAVLQLGGLIAQWLLSRKIKHDQWVLLQIAFCIYSCLVILLMEKIEFGGIFIFDRVTSQLYSQPGQTVHSMNMMLLVMALCYIPIQLIYWLRTRHREKNEQQSGKEQQIREAIARYDPETMIEDEPVSEARPFPRRWIWILGVYGAMIIAILCLGVIFRNP